MSITIGIVKETFDTETRVAATPDTVKKFIAAGAQVVVETGAGASSFFPDADYVAAGATIAPSAQDVARNVNALFVVQTPSPDVVAALPAGVILSGLISPHKNRDLIADCASRNITLMAMELVPRITRAQSMDALSSQSNIAGYRAVIEAAGFYTRGFPMMMTAAGTIAAARVFIMGAGVAGLQAIATARRLGAIVSATDVRPAAKEQVESLGAKFVMIDHDDLKSSETSGGYARELSDDFKQKQAAFIAETIRKQDIVITTALIPGRPAPQLVTADMVASMKPGSVIVDMAVDAGGNVAVSQPGQVVVKDGVTIVGYKNLPGRIATDASSLYARNLLSLFGILHNKETGSVALNFEDDIIKGMTITHGGAVVLDAFKS